MRDFLLKVREYQIYGLLFILTTVNFFLPAGLGWIDFMLIGVTALVLFLAVLREIFVKAKKIELQKTKRNE